MPNYYNVENLITSVRRVIIDAIDDPDIASYFDRNAIIDSMAIMRQDFFGMMPEAFATQSGGLVLQLDENIWGWLDSLLLDNDGEPLTEPDGSYITTIDDAYVDIAGWAINRFVHGVAGNLLEQRGKDEYYRKAAVQIQRTYYGMLPSSSTSANAQSNRRV